MQHRLGIVESELQNQETKMASKTSNDDVTIPHPPTERRNYSVEVLNSSTAAKPNSRVVLELLKTQDRQQEKVTALPHTSPQHNALDKCFKNINFFR